MSWLEQQRLRRRQTASGSRVRLIAPDFWVRKTAQCSRRPTAPGQSKP